jgi:ABC-2 type transport system permease protein
LVKAFQGLGEGVFRLLLFSTPGMIVVSFLFPIRLPLDPLVWVKFFTSLFFSFVINMEINLLTGLCAFFILNNQGLIWSKRVVVDLLSGLIIPLSFFPDWARKVLMLLPFQAISYVPGMILVKGLRGAAWLEAVSVQAAWSFLLAVPIAWIWAVARKRLVVQGG